MCENVKFDVDTTEAERKVDELDNKIENTKEKLIDMGDAVEKETKESFNQVMGMMRASYMMVSGLSQAIGGSLGQIFSAMYSVAVSTIMTYKAIAAAIAASGVGAVQAGLMFASLVTALVQMGALMAGQNEIARRVSGLNMALHGIGGMISSFSI